MLRIVGMTIAALTLTVSTSFAAPQMVKLASLYNPDTPASNALYDFADAINERSKGKFKVQVYANGKLGSAQTAIQALQSGTIQMNMDSTAGFSPFAPKLAIFDLPYLSDPIDERIVKVLYGKTIRKILDECSNKRMYFLDMFTIGPRYMGSTSPVTKLEDLKGLKIRTSASSMHQAAWKAVGASAVPLAMTELVTSLQQGVVDGYECDLSTAVSLHLLEVAKYPAKGITCTYAAMAVNRKWWNSLTDEDRKLFSDTAREFATKNILECLEGDKKIAEELAAQGQPIFFPSPEENARWKQAAMTAWKEANPKVIDPEWLKELQAEQAEVFGK